VKILGPQNKFVGSFSNDISSLDYGYWGGSFTIEDYRIESNEEIDDEEIFALNVELSKNQVPDEDKIKERVCCSKLKRVKCTAFYNSIYFSI